MSQTAGKPVEDRRIADQGQPWKTFEKEERGMSEEKSVLGSKIMLLYQKLCKDNWDANTTGIIIAFLSVLIVAWERSWGATGAVQNWGEWILYGVGIFGQKPTSALVSSASIIGIGFIGGAFVSACLGGDFAFRIPPKLELVKGFAAGIFMGIGAVFAGGCNVGGFYNALGNLSAHGFSMMAGLFIGAIIGLKYLYWEMENISWGQGGGKTIDLPAGLKFILGLAAIAAIIAGTYAYAGNKALYKMSGVLLLSAALGYAFQRGRWCMIQGFREPHMTGDCEMAKAVALSIALLATGIMIVKMLGVRPEAHYLRGTFGWGGIMGGVIFGFGALLAGGCGTGTLWRIGEGQIKLWVVAPMFGISAAITSKIVHGPLDIEGMRAWFGAGQPLPFNGGKLGQFLYMPFTNLGYGGTLALILLVMAAWWVIVDWNEETNKFLVEM